MKRHRAALWFGAMFAFGLQGCGDDNDVPLVDGGPDGAVAEGGSDGGPDAAVDGAVSCSVATAGESVGAACRRMTECAEGLMCAEENLASVPTLTPEGEDGPDVSVTIFEDSFCSNRCSPFGPSTCGTCGDCYGAAVLGSVRIGLFSQEPSGVCRSFCTPSREGNAGCRDGYACDLVTGLCLEACTSDQQCKLTLEDLDDDGQTDIVYDADAPGMCDRSTGRCTVPGDDDARAGDPCTEDTDCADDGLCLTGEAFPGGYCSRPFCDWEGFECETGESCDIRSFELPLCLKGCSVGAEPEADRLGEGGHGQGCADGFSCNWNGFPEPTGDIDGACVPGNYNSVVEPNLGAPCDTDADCYSPYGYGRCLFDDDLSVNSGFCTVFHCAGEDEILPGVESEGFCPEAGGNICANFSGAGAPPLTICVQTCEDATECAPGYACAPLLSGGQSICWATCVEDEECTEDASCRDERGGACSDNETCYCSDAVPRDGGTPEPDAGTGADAGAADAG